MRPGRTHNGHPKIDEYETGDASIAGKRAKAFRRIRLNLLPPEVKRSLVARNVRESRTFSRNPGISLYDRWGSAHPIPVQRPSGPADRPKTGLQEEGRRKREKEGKREKKNWERNVMNRSFH
ncbi:hypothetical protein CDAR_487491 [Caerostris darwini]|uniref:Uncharacterized protein n=1 Tax=Caerostris darwini TaxID=1538125 RepID=A0AAV4PTM6_9ARAC|nr:hypothetical protein CDAR_487491 [Caerostris darwini]